MIREKEESHSHLFEIETWKRCSSLLLKLEEQRRKVSSNYVGLDDIPKELPIVSSLYPDLRGVSSIYYDDLNGIFIL